MAFCRLVRPSVYPVEVKISHLAISILTSTGSVLDCVRLLHIGITISIESPTNLIVTPIIDGSIIRLRELRSSILVRCFPGNSCYLRLSKMCAKALTANRSVRV